MPTESTRSINRQIISQNHRLPCAYNAKVKAAKRPYFLCLEEDINKNPKQIYKYLIYPNLRRLIFWSWNSGARGSSYLRTSVFKKARTAPLQLGYTLWKQKALLFSPKVNLTSQGLSSAFGDLCAGRAGKTRPGEAPQYPSLTISDSKEHRQDPILLLVPVTVGLLPPSLLIWPDFACGAGTACRCSPFAPHTSVVNSLTLCLPSKWCSLYPFPHCCARTPPACECPFPLHSFSPPRPSARGHFVFDGSSSPALSLSLSHLLASISCVVVFPQQL